MVKTNRIYKGVLITREETPYKTYWGVPAFTRGKFGTLAAAMRFVDSKVKKVNKVTHG